MLTLVMVILCSILVSSGTSGLRLATKASHSDQAIYAAEAGLVQVAARFARGEGKDGATYKGDLKTEKVSYEVVAVVNKDASKPKKTKDGVAVPPLTTYLRSVGTAADGTQEVMGALFTLGAGSFRAGVVADRIIADGSHFVAYDSRSNLNPGLTDELATSQGILTSNKLGTPGIDPQFSFRNGSTVLGDIYTARGTIDPTTQVEGIDQVKGHVGILDEKIEIPEIKIPKVDRGEPSDPSKEGEGELEPGAYKVDGIPSDTLQATWDGTRWTFKHWGKTVVLAPGESGSFSPGEPISVKTDGRVIFNNSGRPYKGSVPVSSAPSSENPPTLKDGSYKRVEVNSNHETTLQEGGIFVVEELEITDGGRLALDADSPVTIYVTKRLIVDGENAIANSSKKPPNLKIYYLGDEDVNLAGGSEAYFTLVAPNANINLVGADPVLPEPPAEEPVDPTEPTEPTEPTTPTDPTTPPASPEEPTEPTEPPTPEPVFAPTTSFYGALVGKNVTVKNANFFFDVATDGVGEGSDSNTFVLLSRHRF